MIYFIQDLEAPWWYKYKIQCFGSLVPTRKWIGENRNLSPGDVVLIQYVSKTVQDTYRLDRIQSVEIDADSLRRTFIVKCVLCNEDVTNNP